ncbi:S8 family serine peptidase [Flavobacterium sp.]|jgi:cell wall-associated protease|uniref:S8 family serine peptidase n=1 Tax=Flavobacterium sp. TaxID=239 RepID=UPI0037BEE4E7
MNKLFLILIYCFLLSCKSNQLIKQSINQNLWHYKDILNDSIYGTSFYKWKNENNKLKSKNEIIVAVLDTQIDLNHEAIKGNLWKNEKEIPNNKIDDDNNGYIDDVGGWNFIGYQNDNYYRYDNFEYTKIIGNKSQYKEYNIFGNDSIYLSKVLNKVEQNQNNNVDYYLNWKKSLDFRISNWEKVNDTLKYFFPKEDYTIKQLDSLYAIHKTNDKTFKQRRNDNDEDLGALIFYKITSIQMNYLKIEDVVEMNTQLDSIINRNLNPNLNSRTKLPLGNNILNNNKFQLEHSTLVAGVIGANQNNGKIEGFHPNITIMPLCVSLSGDEYDEDIAKAIYYAVDNGAKIINMSIGKEFSMNQKLVTEALKYAETNNVLIVHAAGNESMKIDEDFYYPNDFDYYLQKETVTNFINVGAISIRNDSALIAPFSNYGKDQVDIFAPGEDVLVAKPNNQYEKDSGTSIAGPMVSGTAALIWLYYPNLSVQEVKLIILESGVAIDKKVIKPGTKDEMVSFSELCKSGKILNTYNAMQMAKQMSRKKK